MDVLNETLLGLCKYAAAFVIIFLNLYHWWLLHATKYAVKHSNNV